MLCFRLNIYNRTLHGLFASKMASSLELKSRLICNAFHRCITRVIHSLGVFKLEVSLPSIFDLYKAVVFQKNNCTFTKLSLLQKCPTLPHSCPTLPLHGRHCPRWVGFVLWACSCCVHSKSYFHFDRIKEKIFPVLKTYQTIKQSEISEQGGYLFLDPSDIRRPYPISLVIIIIYILIR